MLINCHTLPPSVYGRFLRGWSRLYRIWRIFYFQIVLSRSFLRSCLRSPFFDYNVILLLPVNITFVKLKKICDYRRIDAMKLPVNLIESALSDILGTKQIALWDFTRFHNIFRCNKDYNKGRDVAAYLRKLTLINFWDYLSDIEFAFCFMKLLIYLINEKSRLAKKFADAPFFICWIINEFM